MLYAIFHGIFEIIGGGRRGLYTKYNALCITFLYEKNYAFSVTFLYKNHDTLPHIFICKKLCTLRYVFISKIYCIIFLYLTKTVRTIRAIRSKNKFKLFIKKWSYSYNKLMIFIHKRERESRENLGLHPVIWY